MLKTFFEALQIVNRFNASMNCVSFNPGVVETRWRQDQKLKEWTYDPGATELNQLKKVDSGHFCTPGAAVVMYSNNTMKRVIESSRNATSTLGATGAFILFFKFACFIQ